MTKPRPWTEKEDAALEKLLAARLPWREIARHFPQRSQAAIEVHAKAVGLLATDSRDFAFPGAERTTLLHLLDLKRAGHSPRRTEMRIAVDGAAPTRFRTTAATLSLFGSPAASCAEIGSGV